MVWTKTARVDSGSPDNGFPGKKNLLTKKVTWSTLLNVGRMRKKLFSGIFPSASSARPGDLRSHMPRCCGGDATCFLDVVAVVIMLAVPPASKKKKERWKL